MQKELKGLNKWAEDVEKNLLDRGNEPELSIKSLPYFNDKIWGFRRKSMSIIGGRTSQGKTSFAMQIAFDFAECGKSVLYLSLEETEEMLIEKMFCQSMNVKNEDILKGQFNTADIQSKWITFKEMLINLKMLIIYGAGKNWNEINTMLDKFENKPDIVILDYVQAISTRASVTLDMTNEYIRSFREMAVKYNFAGILLSQINRGAESTKDNIPCLWQLKNSGHLEEHADKVILLHFPWFYNRLESERNKFNVIVAKNRYGKTGQHNLNFIPEYYKFEE